MILYNTSLEIWLNVFNKPPIGSLLYFVRMLESEKMLVYYFGLCVGFLLVIFAVYAFIQMYRKKAYPFIKIGKASGAIVLGENEESQPSYIRLN
ncbi:hypothetical protein ACQRXC_22025 (plasmid) [Niallia taxi]|uniref:hypothetical protein n=1 Tax=Niallia taxi TaxID=2499688 RepID=UPI003F623736